MVRGVRTKCSNGSRDHVPALIRLHSLSKKRSPMRVDCAEACAYVRQEGQSHAREAKYAVHEERGGQGKACAKIDNTVTHIMHADELFDVDVIQELRHLHPGVLRVPAATDPRRAEVHHEAIVDEITVAAPIAVHDRSHREDALRFEIC